MSRKAERIKVLAQVGILIALYYLVYFLYVGILHSVPALGDSWDYHIPIARTILDGRLLHPENFTLPQWYYPGSSEIFLSAFIFLHLPLTLSNILATIVLFFCLWKLGMVFRLSYYYALLFATTFCTLNGVIRWMNAISIDIWVAVFFVLAIILLEQPKKSWVYFMELGLNLGMLIGSKYTAIAFVILLLGLYWRTLYERVSVSRFIAFFIPFSFLGLFWYIRNFLSTHNPFYPLDVFGFKGTHLFTESIWHMTLLYPHQIFDAGFGEYKIWLLTVFLAIVWLIYKYAVQKNYIWDNQSKLFLLGIINFFLFLTFPTSSQPWIMVSSFRYSFPVFIPLLLATFLFAQKYKKEEWLGYIAIGSMLMVTSFGYYPKLILIYLPLAFASFYLIQKYEK